jgi:peptide/nickel transport system substrate-binding protein
VTRWLLLLALVLGAGCQDAPPTGIRMGLPTLPGNLDPRYATDAVSSRVCALLYQALTRFDEQSRPQPDMARWQRLGPRHYRFHLLPQRRPFPDGRLPDADDVRATYLSLLDPAAASPHRGTLAVIAGIEVLDAETLDFRLARADALFPGYLGIGILPAGRLAAGHDFNREPWGSGPFVFEGRRDEGHYQLRRRADGVPLSLLRVPDPTVRVLKLRRSEIDLLQNELPPELIGYLAARPELEVQRLPGTTFAYLGFNLEDPLTGDLRLRRAVAHAIDRAAIVRHLFAGNARLAEALLPPEHWAGAAGLAPHPYDPERARALVRALQRELGQGTGQPLQLEYKTSNDPFRLRLATALQAQLAEVGIRLQIRSFDWGTFFGDIKAGRFQLYSLAWVGVESPDIFRYAFHSASLPPGGANRGRFRSAEADALIGAAEAATEPHSVAAYRGLQRLLHQQLVYVPLWYEGHVAASGPRIRGYRLNRRGDYDGLAQVQLVNPS